jgi:HAMP domain-containing protein
MISPHLPVDPDFLRAFAQLTIAHAHLDHMLRMTLKTVANISIEQALDATKYDGSRAMRDRVRKVARQSLGESRALVLLQAVLQRCERATARRNELVHNIIAKELDGDVVMMTDDHKWKSLPTAAQLDAVRDDIEHLWLELNRLRLEGEVHERLNARRESLGKE